MSLKPWREIAKPHKDVLEGRFKQSEFAADISQVHSGNATEEYQNPEKFFSRTFITEGMYQLLMSVAQRLVGNGGDPIIQLQTAFGGGKTHTMLAVYHLASRRVSADKLQGIPPILDEAGVDTLPTAKVAVIDGINLSPSQPAACEDLTINTLWGYLTHQLLGHEGYQMVADSDRDGTSPGKEVLVNLLQKAAPCVILIDELVAYVRQMEPGQRYKGGTFDSNITFIQALTEALKSVPNALLLASLPESDLEIGGVVGQKALNSLEKYFARVESVWKPVATEEAFEIVRRRLFEYAGEQAKVEGICRQFSDFYRQHAEHFPVETQSNIYFDRLCHSYPIHPEVFDRLYEDWSTLEKFQRTRGVLQYMAIVINRLWNSDNKDALIMPGSLPLEDSNVLNKSIHYLPQGWQPIIEREVDGKQSETAEIDGHDTRFGAVQAARRSARTIFLGSAPAVAGQSVRGLKSERILLGTLQPGQTVGVFEDVLKRLRDRLHYLYSGQDRFWFDTKPNLRREMESRKQRIDEREEIFPLIKSRTNKVFDKKHFFSGIHVFTQSGDVPDEYGKGPKLVVLPPEAGYSRGESNPAYIHAEKILRNRGDQPRQKQNRLIFLAPDYDVVDRLKDQAKIFIAWDSIVVDIKNGNLNQDITHLKQAERNRDASEKSLSQLLRETFKWLIVPVEDFEKGTPVLRWEAISISSSEPNLVQAIKAKLKEEEWVIFEWSPMFLRSILTKWYFKDGQIDTPAIKVWQDCCNYLYLPRIYSDTVFKDAISNGVASEDFFGFATRKEEGRYLGFTFGCRNVCQINESSVLIDRETAAAYRIAVDAERGKSSAEYQDSQNNKSEHSANANPSTSTLSHSNNGQQCESVKETSDLTNQFYGTISLDPVKAKMDFATIIDEVVQQFTSELGVNVRISVEIQAENTEGFPENVQRSVKENCNVLKFKSAEFESSNKY